ncbi:hypothetical protein ACWA1F_20435 [Flavobacterium sp. 3-218]
MHQKIVIIFLFLFVQAFGQENTSLTSQDLYTKDGLVYKVSNDSIFSGFIENRRSNDVLLSKTDFKEGRIMLYSEYYNKSKKGIPCRKIYYHENLVLKKKKEDKLDFDGKIYLSTYFDENENKILEESFSEGKLVYSCEYKNGKKNGKQFCLSKNGEELNFIYENGKKVK